MNYQELVSAAKAYADREDIEVSDNMDTYIILAEARINRVLKTRKQSTRISTPTIQGAEYYCVPADYAGLRDIQINSALPSQPHSTSPMNYLNPQQFNIQRGKPYAGSLYYTIIADQIQIYPCQNAGKSIELVYFQKVPNLNESSPTNWMAESHPDIYLSGMVSEIELFAKNYEVAKGWYDRMSIAIDELETSDEIEKYSGAPLTIRTA